MDFSFTDEQVQLRRTVREFAESEIAPHVMEWDEASHFPSEIMPQLAELGLLGVIFPEEYGGAGLGYVEYVIAIELLCGAQALDLFTNLKPGTGTLAAYNAIRRSVTHLERDRVLAHDIQTMVSVMKRGDLVKEVESVVGDLR